VELNNIIVTLDSICFVPSLSAAFRLTDSVFISINQKMHVGGIFSDLAKAYDCVNR